MAKWVDFVRILGTEKGAGKLTRTDEMKNGTKKVFSPLF